MPIISKDNTLEKNSTSLTIDYLNRSSGNDYILGPGDNLKLIVSRFYPELTSFFTIDGEGNANIPKLSRVYLDKLTVKEATQLLNEAYKKFVKYPNVEIQIIRYRPVNIFVSGEVENPGNQILTGSLSIQEFITNNSKDSDSSINDNNNLDSFNTQDNYQTNYFPKVFDALRSVGGITQFTDLSNIQIIRKQSISNGGGSKIATVNFENMLLNGDNTGNIRIYDGDIIKVGKSNVTNTEILQKSILSKITSKFANVFVSGRVERPGNIKVSRAGSLSDAIDMAGGTKVLKGPITFIRFENNGSIDKRKFAFNPRKERGSFKNPFLKDGDIIIVGNSFISSTNQVIKEFTSPFIGIFSTYGLIKAISD
ncbi:MULTISPECIES: SLBB domain-containing protein [unclassified Prochlorococcus]|uniref:SLBB domain-containing protein n=1 Tax=unclassified Prochlorococcus TaxID=2627481 RepID=UPI0012EB22B2|nr:MULTISPECIES: SLBB domain-containing protein [unclassified Prochlorococcus]